jgi:hypothetical protein
MQHIWICIIDGCLIRSGSVRPGDTIEVLREKLFRVYPHMGPESLKVVREDGKIFDPEMGFSNPTYDEKVARETLAAVGVVEGFVGVKIHRNVNAEQVLESEAGSFSGKINDNMDFGVYDFSGEQVASIEDMILHLGPESAPDPLYQPPAESDSMRRVRSRRKYRRVRGGGGGGRRTTPRDGQPQENTQGGASATGETAEEGSDEFSSDTQEGDGDDFEDQDSSGDENTPPTRLGNSRDGRNEDPPQNGSDQPPK